MPTQLVFSATCALLPSRLQPVVRSNSVHQSAASLSGGRICFSSSAAIKLRSGVAARSTRSSSRVLAMASPAGGAESDSGSKQRSVAAQFKPGQGDDKPDSSTRVSTENWLELDGKVVVITGGASGLGNACGEELAARGAKCVSCFRLVQAPKEHRRSNSVFCFGVIMRLRNRMCRCMLSPLILPCGWWCRCRLVGISRPDRT